MKCQVKSKFEGKKRERERQRAASTHTRIPTWRAVECVGVLDRAGASSAISSVAVSCGAHGRSPHRQPSPWHRLPERALLTALLCNANTDFHMSRPITGTPHTLVFRVITPRDPHTHTHTHTLSLCLMLLLLSRMRRGLGLKTNRLGWLTRWKPWRSAATGCFHSCLLSLTPLFLPSSHVYCISLVLIFADKCSLSCCAAPLPSLWTLHQSRSALQMSSPWFHHTSVPFQSSTAARSTCCVSMDGTHTHTHTHTRMGGNVCFNSEGMTPSCQHDPVSPSSSPLPFLNISAILSLHPPLISHTHSPLTPLSLPQAQGPASEMSAPISHVGWCVLSVSFIIEWTDMFSAKLACAQWWKGYLDLWLKLKVVRV